MLCENCRTENQSNYGSGRFCSSRCSRSYSTKKNRSAINLKISESIKNTGKGDVTLICQNCDNEFLISWSKRKQKYCSRSCSIKKRNTNSVLSDETRKRISNGVFESYSKGKNVYGGKTKWYKYKNIKVQGTFELRTCFILDKFLESGVIKDWEYTNDRIKYTDSKGKSRNYLLDFKVFENSDDYYYLEVKGYTTEDDTLKWEAVKSKGHKLIVWFKKDIENIENKLNIPS
jgi:hypothetical protein